MTKSTVKKRRSLNIAIALGIAAMAAAPAMAAPKKTVGPPVADGHTRYLIEYNAGNKQAVHGAIKQYGGRVVYDYSALLNGVAADLSVDGVNSLRTSGLAKTIEEDEILELHDQTRGSVDGGIDMPAPDALPPGYPNGVFSEFVPWGRDRVNADAVWSVGPNFGVADNGVATPDVAPGSVTGAGVVVGVLDTGVDYDHPDLAANIIDDRGDPTIRNFLEMLPGAEDLTFNGHGTSVSSVIASVDNSVGLIGVAPDAKIRPYRVCDGGCPLSAIIGGLVQATVDGVDVINMSFGGGAGKNFEASAIQAAAAAGIVLVASAGNDASQKVQFPAGYGQVLAVGATDINDNPASFTNFGGWVDITGPGVNNPTATCTGCVIEAIVNELSPTARSFSANEMDGSPLTLITNQEVVNVGPGCLANGHAVNPAGKVALIVRGGCSFAEKAVFAESAGAIGTIIYNNAPGNFSGTLGAYIATGPSVSLSQADGQSLAADIAGGTTTVDVGLQRSQTIEYWFISGTSFSGPHVAGVAALVRAANPNLTADEVRKVIVTTAEPFGNQNLFGAGMVRADRAVEAVQP